jgi:hypothetical protein
VTAIARDARKVTIELAPGAEENGLASMLADLVRQNLEDKPHKVRDFHALHGAIAIVADDADVCLTLRFDRGRLTIHDGVVGIPDVAIRGTSDMILALSNTPLTRRFGLPFPDPRDAEQVAVSRSVMTAMRAGEFKMYGALLHPGLVMHLTRVMSING